MVISSNCIKQFRFFPWKVYSLSRNVFQTLQQTTNPKAVGEENRKTYHFEASGSHKINSTHTMGVESRYQKQIAVTEKDGSMETIRTRGGSFSEEKEQAPKFAMSKKRHLSFDFSVPRRQNPMTHKTEPLPWC